MLADIKNFMKLNDDLDVVKIEIYLLTFKKQPTKIMKSDTKSSKIMLLNLKSLYLQRKEN